MYFNNLQERIKIDIDALIKWRLPITMHLYKNTMKLLPWLLIQWDESILKKVALKASDLLLSTTKYEGYREGEINRDIGSMWSNSFIGLMAEEAFKRDALAAGYNVCDTVYEGSRQYDLALLNNDKKIKFEIKYLSPKHRSMIQQSIGDGNLATKRNWFRIKKVTKKENEEWDILIIYTDAKQGFKQFAAIDIETFYSNYKVKPSVFKNDAGWFVTRYDNLKTLDLQSLELIDWSYKDPDGNSFNM